MKFRTARDRRGFSIIEIIIAFALLSLGTVAAVAILRNQIGGNLADDAEAIKQRLSSAQANALAGANGTAWGVHFDNVTTSSAFYGLFQGSSYASVTSTYYLSGVVAFQSPAAGTSTDIVFGKLTGTVSSSASVIIKLKTDASSTKTINVSAKGLISVQ